MLFREKKIAFETLDFLWTIAPFSIRLSMSKPQNKAHKLYIHRDIELHYVFEGVESYTLGEREYEMQAGSLVCVNSFAPHDYHKISDNSKSVTIVISLDYLMKNGWNPGKISFHEYVEDPKVGDMISDIIEEARADDPAHNLRMNALILQLVAYIAGNHSCAVAENEISVDGPQILGTAYRYVFEAIDYINQNFMNNITLDELSVLCKISKYHFLRIFKQITSYTPGAYINRVRTSYAKQLLFNGASVTEAAIASGFSDVHYFSNCFKKYNGCRPIEIKKKSLKSDL